MWASAMLLLPLLHLVPSISGFRLRELLEMGNNMVAESAPAVAKRAFDRVDVSPFDFNKRFNDLATSDLTLSRLLFGSPIQQRRFAQREVAKHRRWAESQEKPKKLGGRRTVGFGFNSQFRLRKRGGWEPREQYNTPCDVKEVIWMQ